VIRKIAAAFFTCVTIGCASMPAARESGIIPVVIETEIGNIYVDLDSARAPLTTANFLRYVDKGLYKDGKFFRVVTMQNQPKDSIRIEVIQGDGNYPPGYKGEGPIYLERTSLTGVKHVDGAISMARGGPNSATSSFFICINDQPALDYGGMRNKDGQGFAAFGRVVNGMNVVRQIQQSPTPMDSVLKAPTQQLKKPVKILNIRRVK
jgi:peptidyl-prolyl cis-trans isomerase A (cyclophilin A)